MVVGLCVRSVEAAHNEEVCSELSSASILNVVVSMENKRPRGRPRLPEDELLHPRKIVHRRSPVTSTQIDKEPTKAALKKYKALVELCIVTIMNQPSRKDNIEKKLRIVLKHPVKWKRPEGWPLGRFVEKNLDGYDYVSYTAELMLLWCWERKLSKYSPTMLYKKRQATMGEITKMENMLDMVDVGEYDGGIEVNQGEIE